MSSNRLLVVFASILTLGLSGCGAGERLSRLNPFQGEETDDPTAPAESERVSVLAFEDSVTQGASFGIPVRLPPAYVNDRWSQPDGFPTHAMQHTQASGPLARAWRRDIGAGSARDRRINARPVVLNGTIYTVDAEGRVVASQADSGSEIWVHRLANNDEARRRGFRVPIPFIGGSDGAAPDRMTFGGGIAVDGNRVVVHRGANYIVALDVTSGEEVWRQTTFTPFHSAPTIADGRVFVSTDDNELVVMDLSDGSVLWTHRGIAESARILTAPSAAVMGDIVIAPYSSGEIVALRVQNGTVLWSDALTRAGGLTPLSSINDIAASPVIMNDQVYAMSHSGTLAALDPRTGVRLWEQPVGGVHTPWIAGDFIYVLSSDSEVMALERQTGALRWVTELPSEERVRFRKTRRISWAGPVLAGNRLVVASSNGEMLILDPATGEISEDRDINDPVFIPPIIANETLYVLSDEARLFAYK